MPRDRAGGKFSIYKSESDQVHVWMDMYGYALSYSAIAYSLHLYPQKRSTIFCVPSPYVLSPCPRKRGHGYEAYEKAGWFFFDRVVDRGGHHPCDCRYGDSQPTKSEDVGQ